MQKHAQSDLVVILGGPVNRKGSVGLILAYITSHGEICKVLREDGLICLYHESECMNLVGRAVLTG